MDRKLLALLKTTSALATAAGVDSDVDAETVNEIEKLWIAAQEVDSKGRRTREASEALRKLSHPKGASTPLARAVPASQKKSLASLSKAQASVQQAMADMVMAIVYQAEFEALRDAQPLLTNRKGEVPSSSKDEDALSFIDWLKQHDVPPYILRRMPEWMREIVARLMLDARDAKFSSAENLWPRLFRSGVLDAKGVSPTQDEKRLLAEAWDAREYGDGSLRESLEQRFGRTLDVSIEFAAAIEAIVRERDALSPVEQEILYCAAQERASLEATMIAALLGLGDDEIPGIEAARQSIISTGEIASRIEHDEFAKAASTIVQTIRECDRRDFDDRHWPEAVADMCANTFVRFQHLDNNDTGFWSLMAVCLELSGLSRKYEDAKGYAFLDMFDVADAQSRVDEQSQHSSAFERTTSGADMRAASNEVEVFELLDLPPPAQLGRAVIPYVPPHAATPAPERASRRYTQEDLS